MTPSITVLAVEDQPLILMEIVGELQARGFLVLEAPNAADAMTILLGRTDIQVLLTDVDMPGEMDGLGLAAEVRQQWPGIKIIIVSGQLDTLKQQMPVGSRFFNKPYRAQDLATAMREMAA
jgi:CheY-like chemotaxis protein